MSEQRYSHVFQAADAGEPTDPRRKSPTPLEGERAKAKYAPWYARQGAIFLELPEDESRILDARFYLMGQQLEALSHRLEYKLNLLDRLGLGDPFVECGAASEWDSTPTIGGR